MKLENTYRAHAIDSLRNSNFIDVLIRDHYVTLKRIKDNADKRLGHFPGSKGSSWKPHLKEIINQVASWPPREKVLGMPVHSYLSDSAISAINESVAWKFLSDIPGCYFTPDFIVKCLRHNEDISEHLPKFLHTESFYYDLVRNNGQSLKAVPIERLSIPLCEEAVKNNGYALKHVPAYFQSAMMCMIAVENEPMALAYVPKSRLSESICLAAVRRNGMSLVHVPLDLRTYNVCSLAVKNNGSVFMHVPDHVKRQMNQVSQRRTESLGISL